MNNTPTILKKIITRKVQEVAERQQKVSLVNIQELCEQGPPIRGFVQSIANKLKQGQAAVIAEVKKASPSKGVIRHNFVPKDIALSYEAAGAACLSVLTDIDFFQGCDDFLSQARNACVLPVLRKDFIIEEYQVYETRALGGDCLLLIVAVFMEQPERLRILAELAETVGLDVLLEVHNAQELELALTLNARLIGINNRNLHTFETSLTTTYDLLEAIPDDRLLVTESGIHTASDVDAMRSKGVHVFLVGEAFMRANDPGAELAKLFGS